MWKHPCAQVIFDSDPAQKGKSTQVQLDEMSQAMIRCDASVRYCLLINIVDSAPKYRDETVWLDSQFQDGAGG